MTSTLDQLRGILVADHALGTERLTEDATLESLGIDSLGTIELLWTVEERFGIEVPSEPQDLETLGDVVRFIDGLVAARDAAARADSASGDLTPGIDVASSVSGTAPGAGGT